MSTTANPPAKKPRNRKEEQMQCALFKFLDQYGDKAVIPQHVVPEFGLVYGILNGLHLEPMMRSIATAQGRRAGVWDIVVDRFAYVHAGERLHHRLGQLLPDVVRKEAWDTYEFTRLYIELKVDGNGLSDEQIAFKDLCIRWNTEHDNMVPPLYHGPAFVICTSLWDAVRVIVDYLGIDHPDVLQELKRNERIASVVLEQSAAQTKRRPSKGAAGIGGKA